MAGNAAQALGTLYNTLTPTGRRAMMRSVVQAVRREQMGRIAKQQDPSGNRYAPRSIDPTREDQARGPMFKKLRLIRNMVTEHSESEGLVGFAARVERIAQVHQEGQPDRPRDGMRRVPYPERQLLGVSNKTEKIVMQQIERHLLK